MRGRRLVGRALLASAALALCVLPADRAANSSGAFPLDPTWAADQPVPGLLRLQLNGLPAIASFVRIAPDGSAIVALAGIDPALGFGDDREGIVRLRADGTLDPAFNPSGAVPGIVDHLSSGAIVDIDLDHHGRVLIAGTNTVERLRADGTPDPTFVATCIDPCVPGHGENPPLAPTGVVYVPNRVYDLVVLGDDSIVVESSNEINQSPYVMRVSKLTATGDRDLNFNSDGSMPGVLAIDDYGPASIAARPDGSFVLTALSSPPRLHHITADGHLDTSYGTSGTAHVPAGHTDEVIWQSAPSGDDLVVLVARSAPAGTPSLIRIHPDGSTDPTFGDAGRLDLGRLGAGVSPGGFFVLADGRILLVMRNQSMTALARLTVDGHLDGSFNPSSSTPGWLVVDPAPDPQHGHLLSDVSESTNGTLVGVGSRFLLGSTPNDPLAEVYRFDAFPGAPQPIDPYPIGSPPSAPEHAPSIDAPATATKPAVRLGQS